MTARRLVTLLVPLWGLATGGCGRAVLDAPDVEGPPSAAGGGGSAGATGAAGTTGAGGAGGTVDAATAFCAKPAACNDLPTMSAIAGTCHVVPPPSGVPDAAPLWYCDCAPGFSVNPKTQLCRAGTACQAAAADPWTVTVDLPTSDCSARVPEDCALPAADPERRIDSDILAFLQRMCHFPSYTFVRVELTNGCASRYQLKTLAGASISPDLVSCLQVFDKYRFTCAQPTDCAMGEWDTLLP